LRICIARLRIPSHRIAAGEHARARLQMSLLPGLVSAKE
jgi:hypothetical protein